jgi:carbonic anhydrase/acetyltransferase-like protein (isoleucine patch superfamily)
MGIPIHYRGVDRGDAAIVGGAAAATGVLVGTGAAFFDMVVIQAGSRLVAGTVVGGACAGAFITAATIGYVAYQGSWTRQSATDEIEKRMKQEMRNRAMTYVGIAKRAFRRLGYNPKYYVLSEEFKTNTKQKA